MAQSTPSLQPVRSSSSLALLFHARAALWFERLRRMSVDTDPQREEVHKLVGHLDLGSDPILEPGERRLQSRELRPPIQS